MLGADMLEYRKSFSNADIEAMINRLPIPFDFSCQKSMIREFLDAKSDSGTPLRQRLKERWENRDESQRQSPIQYPSKRSRLRKFRSDRLEAFTAQREISISIRVERNTAINASKSGNNLIAHKLILKRRKT
jgi:hypothetical protein